MQRKRVYCYKTANEGRHTNIECTRRLRKTTSFMDELSDVKDPELKSINNHSSFTPRFNVHSMKTMEIIGFSFHVHTNQERLLVACSIVHRWWN